MTAVLRRLNGVDAVFLYAEAERTPLHVMGVLVLSASDGGPAEDHRRIRARLEERLGELPVLRRRLVEVPLGLGRPVWAEDPAFDLDHHLRRAALPAPGSDAELADFVARFAEVPLGRGRPLWQMCVVEGLSERRFALVSKIHHAAADGLGCAQLMGALLDVDPAPPPRAVAQRPPDSGLPSRLALAGDAGFALATRPLQGLRQALRSGGLGVRLLRQAWASGAVAAPRTRLNRRVSDRRAVAMGRVDFGHVLAVKQAHQTTVNHVVLAACAGALRHYLQAHGETPLRPLVAAVPVARGPRPPDGMGNALSALLVELPVHRRSPLERLRTVRAASERARQRQESLGGELAAWADVLPPALLAGASRLYGQLGAADWHPPLQNLIVSNVPGPQLPLYLAGAKVQACHPFGPIYDGCALNLTVMSYDGGIGVGAIACPEAVPDVGMIPRAFEANLSQLLRHSGAPKRCTRKPRHSAPAPVPRRAQPREPASP